MTREDDTGSFSEWDHSISMKWQEFWESHNMHTPTVDKSKRKFYLTAAYPYPNAPLHLGHGRTYLIPDVIARYYRMKGYNVLFPMGFHYTGTPILTMSEAIAKNDPKLIKELIELQGVPEEDIDKLTTPLGIASYFREWAKRTMKNYMLSIDWTREFTTVDPEYQSFITWQFEKLRKKGYVVQGTHPVGWCPIHENPVGMHDTKDDVEPEIQEFTLIFFRDNEGTIYPAATLRPETVYGVTNMWVNPEARYVVAEVDNQEMVLSERAAYKLKFQKDNVRVLREIDINRVLGSRVLNPMTGRSVPILPASFVDPDTGTGVVMSVPAHAPYDYAALVEVVEKGIHKKYRVSPEELEPIPLITIEGYTETPARFVVEKMGIKGVNDRKKLDEATKEVYLKEHSQGIMRTDIHRRVNWEALDEDEKHLIQQLEGKPVKDIREYLIEWMRRRGLADVFYEIANKPVYCRCGTEIVVKILKNQWFIDYENSEWKDTVRKALQENVEVIPPEYKPWFYNTIDWLKKRACARKRGLGTPLPWDREWVIESLSDSTIYMAFYTVVHLIRKHGLKKEQLTEGFWDYVFLGRGDPLQVSMETGVPEKVLKEMREEFTYWYPLDNRHSGKDLVPNHLTFMVFNHTAIFPPELWPRRIVVNGHIMIEGQKMSKSLGNFIPLHKAIEEVGPNTLRLALILSSEIGKDSNYTRELVDSTRAMLRRIMRIVEQVSREKPVEDTGQLERWLAVKARRRIIEASENIETYRLRAAALNAFTLMEQDVSNYLSMGGTPGTRTLKKIVDIWVKLMAPFTPGYAEELWHIIDSSRSSIFEEEWPRPEDTGANAYDEALVSYLESIRDDVESIVSAAKTRPKRIDIVLASKGSSRVLSVMIKGILVGEQSRKIIGEAIKMLGPSKNLYGTVRSLYEFLVSLPRDVLEALKDKGIDEEKVITEYIAVLERMVGAKVRVLMESEAPGEVLSRRRPLPLKPALNLIF